MPATRGAGRELRRIRTWAIRPSPNVCGKRASASSAPSSARMTSMSDRYATPCWQVKRINMPWDGRGWKTQPGWFSVLKPGQCVTDSVPALTLTHVYQCFGGCGVGHLASDVTRAWWLVSELVELVGSRFMCTSADCKLISCSCVCPFRDTSLARFFSVSEVKLPQRKRAPSESPVSVSRKRFLKHNISPHQSAAPGASACQNQQSGHVVELVYV